MSYSDRVKLMRGNKRELFPKDAAYLEFPAGTVLFNQGDSGGELFFIESGIVDVYVEQNGHKIVVAEMGQNEIIGVMTFLTAGPRLASVRARTDVVCRKVSRMQIRTTVNHFPKWMRVMLKEFTLRISEMNTQFSDAVIKIKELEANQINILYTSGQVASAILAYAEMLKKFEKLEEFLAQEDLYQFISLVTNQSSATISKIIEAFTVSGLLVVGINPDTKKKGIRSDMIHRLTAYPDFLAETKSGKGRKLVRAKFTTRQIMCLRGMCKYAIESGLSPSDVCSIPLKELAQKMEFVTQHPFDEFIAKKGASYGLFVISSLNGAPAATFVPQQLSIALSCLDSYRRITTNRTIGNPWDLEEIVDIDVKHVA